MTVRGDEQLVPMSPESSEATPAFQRWWKNNLSIMDGWTRRGLLHDIDSRQVEEAIRHGFILVTCSDGDEVMVDIMPHLQRWIPTNRITLFGCRGGGLMADPEFPYHRMCQDVSQYWLSEIREAFESNCDPVCFLLTHVPCRRAWAVGYGIHDQVRSLIRAKDRIKQGTPGIKVGFLLQADRGQDCEFGRRRYVTRSFRARHFRDKLFLQHAAAVETTV